MGKDKAVRQRFIMRWKERTGWVESGITFFSRVAAEEHAWTIGCKRRSGFRIYKKGPSK